MRVSSEPWGIFLQSSIYQDLQSIEDNKIALESNDSVATDSRADKGGFLWANGKKKMIKQGLEPGTFSVLRKRDNLHIEIRSSLRMDCW